MRALDRMSEAVRDATPVLSESTQARQRARLVEAVSANKRQAWSGRWLLPLVLAGVCVAGTALWLKTANHPTEVAKSPVVVNERWWSSVKAPTSQLVGDRGELELAEGSTAHLEHSGKRVGVVLDRGKVVSSVKPKQGTDWAVRAGSYLVEAVGTRFSVGYDPAAEKLVVQVQEGSVQVSGGQLGRSKVKLELGQSLSVLGSQVSIDREPTAKLASPASGADTTSVQESEQGAPVTGKTTSGSLPETAGKSGPATEPTWLELHAAGDHRQALVKVQELGFDRLVSSLGCSELTELADVARLARDNSRADRALLALRARCRATPGGLRAAFLLGRLKDESSPAEAASWYNQYLAEGAADRFADQALGRLISAEQRAGRPEKAKAAADRYLRLYPAGSYAQLAQSLASH